MHVDEQDVQEMERLAKRLLALCAKYRDEVDEHRSLPLRRSSLTPERKAELVAQMRQRLARKGVTT